MKSLIALVLIIASVYCINATLAHEHHHQEKAQRQLVVPTISLKVSEKIMLEFLVKILGVPSVVAEKIAHLVRNVDFILVRDFISTATEMTFDIAGQDWINLYKNIYTLIDIIPEMWKQLDKKEVDELIVFLINYYNLQFNFVCKLFLFVLNE